MRYLLPLILIACGCSVRDPPRRPGPALPVLTDAANASVAAAPVSKIASPVVVPDEPAPVMHPPMLRSSPDPTTVMHQTNGALRDIFFEYDRSDLRPGSLDALQQNAALLAPILRDFPRFTVLVEGHCDERGSAEYNLGLGDHRAARVSEMLRGLGVAASQLRTVSYGKEMPQCIEASESCWQRNRRAHLRLVSGE